MQTARSVESIEADIRNVIAYSNHQEDFLPSLLNELRIAKESAEVALAIRCALKIREDFPELDLS